MRVRGVRRSFDSELAPVRALRGLDLEVADGEFVAIMGPSGCGKSTLLNIIAGLDQPDEGEVEVAGERLDGQDEERLARFRRRHVGVVFQFFSLLDGITVLDNLVLPGILGGLRRKAAAARGRHLLDLLGIGEHGQRLPSALSGGERQRLAIARALVNEPGLLLADEPTGALDSDGAAEVLALLRQLHGGGQTIVMVTHDMAVAAGASRIVRLRDGRVARDGAAAAQPAAGRPGRRRGRGLVMRLIAEWTMLDLRRRWRSLLALALLVAVAAATVLTAMAGARRGETAFARLWARTSPATVTVLPNQPGFDWARIRALPEVAALATFAVSAFEVVGHPELSQDSSFPLGSTSILRTIEHPVVLQGRLVSPGRADEVDVTPLVPRNFGVGVGGTLQLRLATAAQIDQGHGPYNGYPALGRVITVHVVGVVRSPWFSDGVGSVGSVIPSPALMARYRPDIVGSHAEVYVNALVRLKGGASAIPRFRAALARVTGRPDIQVWNNWQNFGEQVVRTTGYEAACLLAFGLAALAAAVFLIGQSVARYCSAAIADLQLLRAPGITPRQASASAAAGPLLAAVAGGTLGVAGAIPASNWMPIGAASYAEPSPGISADWLVLGPGWAAVPVLVLAGALASAARAQAAARTQREPRRSAVAATALAAGVPVPMLVGTRFALEPGRGRSALPVRPALAGAVAGVLGVLAAFTFSAGITHAAANPALFGQTFQLEAFTGLDSRSPRPVAPVLRAVAASREVASEEDVRSAIAQSGAVSLTVYAGLAGRRQAAAGDPDRGPDAGRKRRHRAGADDSRPAARARRQPGPANRARARAHCDCHRPGLRADRPAQRLRHRRLDDSRRVRKAVRRDVPVPVLAGRADTRRGRGGRGRPAAPAGRLGTRRRRDRLRAADASRADIRGAGRDRAAVRARRVPGPAGSRCGGSRAGHRGAPPPR